MPFCRPPRRALIDARPINKQEQACEEAHPKREAAHIQPGRRVWVGAVMLGDRSARPGCAVSTSQHSSPVRQNASWIRP